MARDRKALNHVIREARRARGLTQSELAKLAGSNQSAISMFESGQHDSLAHDKIKTVAEVLDLDLAMLPSWTSTTSSSTTLKYCPIDECPSNTPFVVAGRLCFWCDAIPASPDKKTRCPYCGELLEHQCPNPDCGAALTPGGFCMQCGTAYVRSVHEEDADPMEWADDQQERVRHLRALIEPRDPIVDHDREEL